jgi:Ca2+-binding RTX toxin-like protein
MRDLTRRMRVIGSQCNDAVAFAAGVNVVDGRGGDESITAGAGNDILSGGESNDTLVGVTGNDVMTGGAGNDMFVFGALNASGRRRQQRSYHGL